MFQNKSLSLESAPVQDSEELGEEGSCVLVLGDQWVPLLLRPGLLQGPGQMLRSLKPSLHVSCVF